MCSKVYLKAWESMHLIQHVSPQGCPFWIFAKTISSFQLGPRSSMTTARTTPSASTELRLWSAWWKGSLAVGGLQQTCTLSSSVQSPLILLQEKRQGCLHLLRCGINSPKSACTSGVWNFRMDFGISLFCVCVCCLRGCSWESLLPGLCYSYIHIISI